MDDDYTSIDNSSLFDHHAHGQTAEQQLAELPDPQDVDGLKHHAVLLSIAHNGRQARGEILRRHAAGEFLDPRHVVQANAVQQQSQEEQDQQIFQGLSTGQLVIASPEDEQRLANNANARAKFRSSPYVNDEDRDNLIAQTYADDAEIRRAARPIPPEQRGRSWDTQLQKLMGQMDPNVADQLSGLVVRGAKGEPQVMRGVPKDVFAGDEGDRDDPLFAVQGSSGEYSVPTEKVGERPQQPPQPSAYQPPPSMVEAEESRYKALKTRPDLMNPALLEEAKDGHFIGAIEWNRKTGHYEVNPKTAATLHTIRSERMRAEKEQWAESHPKGTSPEERVQATEERRRQFEEREYDRGSEQDQKNRVALTEKIMKHLEENTPKVPDPDPKYKDAGGMRRMNPGEIYKETERQVNDAMPAYPTWEEYQNRLQQRRQQRQQPGNQEKDQPGTGVPKSVANDPRLQRVLRDARAGNVAAQKALKDRGVSW